MKNSEQENKLILETKNNISAIIEKYSVIPEKEIHRIVDTCILSEYEIKDAHRVVIQWKDSYYSLKGKNIVFQPIKFIKLLLSIMVSLADLNFITIVNIFCDVLDTFSITLSQDESTILLCIYKLANMEIVNDDNFYAYYSKFATERNVLVLNEREFRDVVQKLADSKLIIIENGNYFVVDKIIGNK